MGIGLNSLLLLSRVLPTLGDLSDKRVLTLGLQDCYFTYDQLLAFLEKHRIPHHPLPAGAVKFTTGFKWLPPKQAEKCRDHVHQEVLFRLLGFDPVNVHALDASEFEQADIIHDLNKPVDDGLVGRFDLVFDGGTIEHVFSLKDSLFNTARMCRAGGVVVHISPVDYLNHGFINLTTGLYQDFYLANGFEELSVRYIAAPTNPRRGLRYFLEFAPEDLNFSLRHRYATMVFAAFRKVEDCELIVPQQGFYRRLWEASGNGDVPTHGGRPSLVPDRVKALAYSVAPVMAEALGRYARKWRGKRVAL